MRVMYIEEELKVELNRIYKKYKPKMTDRWCNVFINRFLMGYTMKYTAGKMKITRQRVLSIQNKIIALIRKNPKDLRFLQYVLRDKRLKNWNMKKLKNGYKFYIKDNSILIDFTITEQIPEQNSEEFIFQLKEFVKNKCSHYKRIKKEKENE